MDVTICIPTHGSNDWVQLAQRAIKSAAPHPFIHYHGRDLTDARNTLLKRVQTEWVIYLDADDELTPGYVEAMSRGVADVRGPIALYIDGAGRRFWQPRVAGHRHDCTVDCLPEGNWLLIGAAVRTEMLREAGGWRDFPWSEDWDTWLRCRALGATFQLVPDAIYQAHVRHDSRNRGAARKARLDAHLAIHRANFPELYEDVA